MIIKSTKGYSSGGDSMYWITGCRVYVLAVTVFLLSQMVTSQGTAFRPGGQSQSNKFGSPYSSNNNNQWQLDQLQSSGSDGLDFEDDDEEPMSSGGGPVSPPVSQPPPPGVVKPGQGGTGRGNINPQGGAGRDNVKPGQGAVTPAQGGAGRGNTGGDDDLFDSWRNNKNNPPSGPNNNNRGNVDKLPYGPGHADDDDDDLYEASGDIILDPEKKEEVPKVGGEVRVDPPTAYPPYVAKPTSNQRPPGENPPRPVERYTPALPSDPFHSTTTKGRPDGNPSDPSNYKGNSPFFKIFNDPLVLAGIISGAVLALLCIVLLIMFMIYRMRKKDEGSYALGEPKRTYDIRYTRTKDQEYFA